MAENGLSRNVSTAVKNDLWKNAKDFYEPGKMAIHHAVPVDVANNSDFIAEVYDADRYQARMNTKANLILLLRADAGERNELCHH